MKIPRSGLALKLILSIFISTTIVFTVIFTYNYFISKNMIEKNLRENAKNLTLTTVNKIEKVLTSVSVAPDNLAKILENSNYTDADIKKYLRLMVQNNTDIYGATLAFEPHTFRPEKEYYAPYFYKENDSVKMIYLGNSRYHYFTMDWYQIPKELSKPMWSEPYMDEGGGKIVMTTYSVPIYKKVNGTRRLVGILTADLSLEWLREIVGAIKIYKTGYAWLISKNGSMVVHPIKDVVMNETVFTIAEEQHSDVLRQIGRNMIAGKSSFADVEYRNIITGKKSWISYAPVKMNGWSLGIVYPVDEFMADIYHLNTTVMLLAIGGGILLLFVIIFISRSITSPLRNLSGVANQFAQGNYEIELPDIKSRDEIGNLNQSFKSMQSALIDTILKLNQSNEELAEYSTTLEEKVEIRTKMLSEKNKELDLAFSNIKTLSQIGQKITSTLDLELIFNIVYENVNSLLEASVFLILVFDKENNCLICKHAIENGEKVPEFSFSMEDKNRFAVWCVDNRKPVFMNDVDVDYKNYVETRVRPKQGGYACSLIYLPLIVEDRIIGAMSVQTIKKNAYSQLQLDMMMSLASHTAIALDNAFAYETINKAHKELKDAQTQLVQAEKMASLGQLTAGIAHEIKNPLNFVNNFAELSIDLTKELREELESQKDVIKPDVINYLYDIIKDLEHNVTKINEHGKRADSIVKGMLLHSRGKAGEMQKTDINNLLMEYINLAYHGFRAQDSSFNVKFETDYDSTIGFINVVPQDISRVFLNIINNACFSVHEKKREKGDRFNPVISVCTRDINGKIRIAIKDNGKGIPQDIIEKIFNPFFTTKPTGKGTGLGLSLSFDIVVQVHKGDLKVNSVEGEYAEFIITLPKDLS